MESSTWSTAPANDAQEHWTSAWAGWEWASSVWQAEALAWWQSHGHHDWSSGSHNTRSPTPRRQSWSASQPRPKNVRTITETTADYPMSPDACYLTSPWPCLTGDYPEMDEVGSWDQCKREAQQLCCWVKLRGRQQRRRRNRPKAELTVCGPNAVDAFYAILEISQTYVPRFDRNKVCVSIKYYHCLYGQAFSPKMFCF